MTEYYKISKDTLDDIADTIREMNPNAPQEMSGEDFATYIRGIVDSSLNSWFSKSITRVNYNGTSLPEGAFKDCSDLENVNLPNVTSIGSNTFYLTDTSSKLKVLSLPELLQTTGTYALWAVNLEELNIPKCTTLSAQSANNATKIKKIYAPNLTSIGTFTFYQITALEELYLGATVPSANANQIKIVSTTKIYVPVGTKASYVANSFWGAYSSQIYEYTPNVNIDNVSFTTSGSSWRYFIESDANTLGMYIEGNNIRTADGRYLKYNGSFVLPSESYNYEQDYVLEAI